MNYGTACAKAPDALTWIDPMLEAFPGKYVTLNFGTNDGWAGSGDPTYYYNTMLALVDKVLAKGKTPVVATIPWPNNTGTWQTGIETFNTKITALYQARPQILRGPDLYTLTKGRTNLYRATGDPHPNDAGAAIIRTAWANTALGSVR
jgi:lysophospholipase L1-like esterase